MRLDRLLATLAVISGLVVGGVAAATFPPDARAGEPVVMAVPEASLSTSTRREERKVQKQQRRGKASARMCQQKEQKIAKAIRAHRACRTDDDCRLLVRGCSPYLTCGQPVNEAGLNPVKQAIANYAKRCSESAPSCVACPERGVKCEAGLCRVHPPVVCTQDVRSCPDGSTVSRNPDYDCQFDPCPVPAPQEGGGETSGGRQEAQ